MEIVVMCTVYRSKWEEVGVAVATSVVAVVVRSTHN